VRAVAPGSEHDGSGADCLAADTPAVDARVGETVAGLLTQPDSFARQWARDQHDVRRLWARLESRTTHRMVDEYAAALEDPAARLYGLGLPSLLSAGGHHPEAHAVAATHLADPRRDGDPARVQQVLWPS